MLNFINFEHQRTQSCWKGTTLWSENFRGNIYKVFHSPPFNIIYSLPWAIWCFWFACKSGRRIGGTLLFVLWLPSRGNSRNWSLLIIAWLCKAMEVPPSSCSSWSSSKGWWTEILNSMWSVLEGLSEPIYMGGSACTSVGLGDNMAQSMLHMFITTKSWASFKCRYCCRKKVNGCCCCTAIDEGEGLHLPFLLHRNRTKVCRKDRNGSPMATLKGMFAMAYGLAQHIWLPIGVAWNGWWPTKAPVLGT